MAVGAVPVVSACRCPPEHTHTHTHLIRVIPTWPWRLHRTARSRLHSSRRRRKLQGKDLGSLLLVFLLLDLGVGSWGESGSMHEEHDDAFSSPRQRKEPNRPTETFITREGGRRLRMCAGNRQTTTALHCTAAYFLLLGSCSGAGISDLAIHPSFLSAMQGGNQGRALLVSVLFFLLHHGLTGANG